MQRVGLMVASVLAATGMWSESAGWQATTEQPRFKATTELITIDVVATRADGRPATDLEASDFELLESGIPRKIEVFQFIDLAALPSPTARENGVWSNQEEPGAIFVVVLDEIGVRPQDVVAVRRIATQFLERALQPQDQVAVVRSGSQSGFFLTSDRALVVDAIARSTGRREGALGLEQPGPNSEVTADVGAQQLTPGRGGKNSFRVLVDVIERLRPIRARRKAILWFSRGGDITLEDMEALIQEQASPRADDAFAQLITTARAANVAVYAIDPRGLDPDVPIDALATLRDLATATGGRAIVNANDFVAALTRVAAENRSYYLLGYQSADQSRRVRKIDVRTKVPGVSLLHRSVSIAPRAEKIVEPELLASPLPIRDLPIALAPAAVIGKGGQYGVVVPFEIGTSLANGAEVEFVIAAFDSAGRQVARATGRAVANAGRAVGVTGLRLDAKILQLRLAARVRGSETQGVAFASVNLTPSASVPACRGFLFEQPGAARGLRQFDRTKPLTISTIVSATALGESDLVFALGAIGSAHERTWPIALGKPLAKGAWRFSLTLRPPLPEGKREVSLLNREAVLGEGCRATFETH